MTSTATASSTSSSPARPDRADGFLSKQGRRDVRGSVAARPESPISLAGWSVIRPTTTTTASWTYSFLAGRGFDWPIRPTLLRNNGAGGFTDVTREAGLLDPVNSNGAAWGDFDNDGWIDLFVACEHQLNRLYHNRGDGTFEEIASQGRRGGRSEPLLPRAAPGSTTTTTAIRTCSSTTWKTRAGSTTTSETDVSPK